MRRRIIVVLAALGLIFGSVPVAGAQEPPPPGEMENLEFIRNVGGLNNITSINVLDYGNRDVLVAVGRFGLKTFDLSDPERPVELGHLPSDDLRLAGDVAGTFWQSESTNVDQRRKLVFLSRDPRAYNGPQNAGVSGVYIVDVRDPRSPQLITFHPIPAGHTSTCINDCQFLWTGGPASDVSMPPEWGGRPIYVTDVRNPRRPFTYPDPIDIERNNGITDYAHDVQVDNAGVAWVSGRGAVRGYWTEGRHWDPVQERYRVARAWDPVPYAGGGGPTAWAATGPAVVHNAERPIDGKPGTRGGVGQRDPERPERPAADAGADLEAHGFEEGELLYITHEDFNGSCSQRGRFYIASLRGSTDGESWRATPDNPFSLDILSSWHPTDLEGFEPGTNNCSGHYFRMQDGLVYMSWYGLGTRVLDVRDPYNPVQVAYFWPTVTSSYTPMLYEGLLYVADSSRGIDILRLDDAAYDVAASGEPVVAEMRSAADVDAGMAGYEPDPIMGWLCPVPTGRTET